MLLASPCSSLGTDFYNPFLENITDPLAIKKQIESIVDLALPLISTTSKSTERPLQVLRNKSVRPYTDTDLFFNSLSQKIKDINLEIFYLRLMEQIDPKNRPELIGSLSQKAAMIRLWMRENTHFLDEIRILNLEAAPLSHLPPEINLLSELEELSLAHSSILDLPDDLHLPYLRKLNLSHTQIKALPKSFALPDIDWLNLEDPKMEELLARLEDPIWEKYPERLAAPIQSQMELVWLDLSYTQIKALPKKFNPPYLEWLSLRHTPITDLPPEFDPPNLEYLDLSETTVPSLPKGVQARLDESSDQICECL